MQTSCSAVRHAEAPLESKRFATVQFAQILCDAAPAVGTPEYMTTVYFPVIRPVILEIGSTMLTVYVSLAEKLRISHQNVLLCAVTAFYLLLQVFLPFCIERHCPESGCGCSVHQQLLGCVSFDLQSV